MEFPTFNIIFDNPHGAYMTNSLISGNVVLNSLVKKNIKGVSITFRGDGKISWSEEESSSKQESSVVFGTSENYFIQTLYIYGDGQSTETLQRGQHTFPFAFHLPLEIPTSFLGKYGFVQYEATASIHPFDQNAISTIQYFSVNSIVDLNTIPKCQTPVALSEDKTICCLCWASGPITAKLHFPKTGFVPGESILFSAEVINKSSRAVTEILVQLIQNTTFISPGATKLGKEMIEEMKLEGIAEEETKSFDNVKLTVPPIPPSELPFCNIISIAYELQFSVIPSGMSMALEVIVPLTIGTIPIYESLNDNQENSVSQQGWIQPSAPPLMPPNQLYPPVFQDYTMGNLSTFNSSLQTMPNPPIFVPQYPVYPSK